MARMPGRRRRAQSPTVTGRVPVIVSGDQIQAIVTREGRMARFVAGSRFVRLVAIGGLIAAGWLLGVVFGAVGAGPVAAEARVPARQVPPAKAVEYGHGHQAVAAGAVEHGRSAGVAEAVEQGRSVGVAGAVGHGRSVGTSDVAGRGRPVMAGDLAVLGDPAMAGAAGARVGRLAEGDGLVDADDLLDDAPAGHPVRRTGRAGSPMSGDLRGVTSERGDGSATSHVATGPASAGGFPTVRVDAPADAGAMAGRAVDGLTSQSKPLSPQPSTADHSAGANGFVPRPGSGPFGSGFGDVARSVFDPRLAVAPAEMASVLAPVVRAVADDPSFSPD
ncbi:hypothetical protein [Sphaerisporangium rhizosphaerae]|uniref:Uncharacterized protein n=1 Tax=Sphaerisporangium rhizosphaerae TaxID=2269375 RepID=A0ABW2P0W8_9ACTN